MRRSTHHALGLTLSFVLCACGGSTSVTARVIHPAAIPLRAHPEIWIAIGGLPEEELLSATVSADLTQGETEVRQVHIDQLEPARLAGRIPPGSAVVIFEIEFDESTVTRWGSRPDTLCGPAGCYTTTRSYAYNVPAVGVTLKLTVYDGPSAQVKHRMTLRERDSGRDFDDLRNRSVMRLAERVRILVSRRREDVDVELLDVDHPMVERALRTLREGDWPRGRAILEEVPNSTGWRALDRPTRARILYNLGQARRFDPSTMENAPRHFRAAKSALSAAARLDPNPVYQQALEDLALDRARSERLRRQDQNAARNFATRRDAPSLPPVPETYRR